ncbi:hypothetical protein BZA77DRAFT_377948 [Pyronema omphalodes]|nr:hypothetical protein BZA77DRAFT_377948 [Pyronema omphalodes]
MTWAKLHCFPRFRWMGRRGETIDPPRLASRGEPKTEEMCAIRASRRGASLGPAKKASAGGGVCGPLLGISPAASQPAGTGGPFSGGLVYCIAASTEQAYLASTPVPELRKKAPFVSQQLQTELAESHYGTLDHQGLPPAMEHRSIANNFGI